MPTLTHAYIYPPVKVLIVNIELFPFPIFDLIP